MVAVGRHGAGGGTLTRDDTSARAGPTAALVRLRDRAVAALRDRWRRVRAIGGLAVQAGLAAALSWMVAYELLHISQPVFAPISAVSTLAASVGQRLRRTIELIIGVTVGVLIGDLLLVVIGTGWWQLGLIVVLAIMVALFLVGSAAVVLQAGATAVLIATLSPSVRDLEVPRFVDALIGGAVALLVTAVLLPLNPLRVLNRAARPAMDLLTTQLDATATALRERDVARARAALTELRQNAEEVNALIEATRGARETNALSPVNWHYRHGPVGRYAQVAEPIDRAMRNSGTLIRRVVTLIEDGEPVPEPMPRAVADLAETVRLLKRQFAAGDEPLRAREQALRAVRAAGDAYRAGVGFSGAVVVAQIRTTVSDLMVGTGLTQEAANRLVRRDFGDLRPPVVTRGR
ncbi:aromatic acid exporter family protein [Micromonospora sp. STR1_7]|uniref:Aromatic acid exporter family protein n=1 Tax=Micromonospora parastrephiae TaxID=2806101 RepID=A0ABS1XNZ2_9ACTN|nr:FUSC family protein [Micromonospora parastrephiae]MBM0230953.1 aromatic acid exporter family protein [Micromonospora parastrephiae]